MADNGVGGVQNVLGGAVVLLQPDDTRTPELPFEAEDIGDVRAAEAIDALVVITHHADVFCLIGQQRGQAVLQGVGVLILVDEDVAELALVVFPHVAGRFQQPHRVPQQVVEIQCVGVPQLFIVKRIHFTHSDFTPVVDGFPLLREILRRLHVIFGAGDDGLHLPGREGLLLQLQFLDDVLDDALAVVAVVDGEAAVKAQSVDVAAQDADAGGVERGRPHVGGHLLPQHPAKALLQLVGGLVGKGDSQHLPGARRLHRAQVFHQRALSRIRRSGVLLQKLHLVLGDGDGDLVRVAAAAEAQQVGHPVDQHRGLAGAGASQQQQRPLGGQNALPLAGVQVAVFCGDGIVPRLDKSSFQICHGCLAFPFLLPTF